MLPKVNDTPKYETSIPSTGQKIKYRPYLVKEEKVLLLAMESQDQHQALAAIADTVEACVLDKIEKDKLTTFDVEFLFLKIRSKSVGEKSHLKVECSSCSHENQITLNLDDIKLAVSKQNPVIKLTDKISLKMRWPSYVGVTTTKSIVDASTATEQAFAVIAKCVESIQTDTENFLTKDVPESELIEFLENLTSDQYKLLVEFVKDMPKLTHEVTYHCEKCSALNTVKLEGIRDFF